MKRSFVVAGLALAVLVGACGSSGSSSKPTASVSPVLVNGEFPYFDDPVTLRVLTHDSFAVTQAILDEFETETNVKVELIPSGDAVAMTNAAILTAGNPVADVIFGFDENLLGSVLENNLLQAYTPDRLSGVDQSYVLDTSGMATPIDHGDVCVNFDRGAFTKSAIKIPATFDELAQASVKNEFVVENPSTSTPGLAFMLATIARFGGGDDVSASAKWLSYWKQLRANGVSVVDSWETAYYGSFSGGSGKGNQSLVVSYASSPSAEVGDTSLSVEDSPTGVITETCYRQIEFAGILRGASSPRAAAAFLEFMLGSSFQADVPGQMYVYPVVTGTPLPDTFAKYTAPVSNPLTLPYMDVAANRDRWIAQWSALFR
jgi:thiamine transport system substrate-binding protein